MPSASDVRVEGVVVTPLPRMSDERGAVLRMLRVSDAQFAGFGEIYFSEIKAGAVKAWRRHRRMIANLAVPRGRVRIAIYDDRAGSVTRGSLMVIDTGADDYSLITIPPGTWCGFACVGSEPALVANCASLPHDPDELDRRPADDPAIPYRWTT